MEIDFTKYLSNVSIFFSTVCFVSYCKLLKGRTTLHTFHAFLVT